ncbi:MAG: transcription termination factor NusA [Bacillota bacterium]|nr:transcription termination factor NusA [Bacillota bacterium]HHU61865.1 transcription termination/antitermination protein NusA [Natronincola sp.]
MNVELISALTELEKERGISKDVLIEAIETAIVSAFKKNYGTSSSSSVRVEFNQNTGAINVFSRREVVDEIEDPTSEIELEEAKEIDINYDIGDVIEEEVTPADFGRIAAQTAKQVVIQKIREAERSNVYDAYSNREGDVVSGTVQRADHRQVIVDLGDVEAVLPLGEQIPGEQYGQHGRLRFYINEVRQSSKGPQVFLSRTHPGLLKALFEFEVPEIQSGEVEIKSVAREAGNRSKIAVYSRDDNIDPIGACVGSRGSRVQSVVSELGNERIDIVEWVPDTGEFIKNALSPAKVIYVRIDEEEKVAYTVVPNDQLSLAIGKAGQNARLAARLTGWRIDIKDEEQAREFFDELELITEEETPDELDQVETVEETAEEPESVELVAEKESEVKEKPVIQEISEEDIASLTNVVKRKSWQERFGVIDESEGEQEEAEPVESGSEDKQETDKTKKKKEMVITDLSQLDSIDFKFDGKK